MIPNCKHIYLCSPDRKPQFVLNGVQADSVDCHIYVKGYSELSFTVNRYISINGELVQSNGYEDLKPYMYVYLEDIGFFQIQAPTVSNDENKEVKEIEAFSAEKEFENKDWKGLKINTGEKDSVEYLYQDNIDNIGFAKRYVILYDINDARFSFLDMILEKVSYWTVGYVSYSVRYKQIPSLDINNENLYAVMTSEVGPRLQCLFVFDFLNFKINVYGKNDIEFDTGIFIGFRNLAQNINISVDQDSIYTRFSVQGEEELNFRHYNYGDDRIYNLDYFLCEPYMEEDLANKIKGFNAFKDQYRQDYFEISKEAVAVNDRLYQLKYAVPSDDLYWKNWDSMNEEGLQENLKYYNSLLESLQIAVDERPNEEKFEDYGGPNEKYLPIKKNGEVDHEYYLNLLYEKMGQFSGYYTYKEIHEYIIPYIELALDNIQRVIQGEDPLDPEEDLSIGIATENWDLYGLEELQGVRKSYEEDLSSKLIRYSKPWSELTEEDLANYNLNYISEAEYEASYQRKEYLHLQECLGNKEFPQPGTIYYRLVKLQSEIEEVEAQLAELNKRVSEFNNIMQIDITSTDTYEDDSGNEVEYQLISDEILMQRENYIFTTDEVDLITNLFHDTDYTNSNILVTSINTEYETLDKEIELYNDATDKLVEVSQPQYIFSVSLDNLLRLTQYEGWYDDLKLLRFIWLGIRDDYSTKLRVIGYRWNPCDVTSELQLEFSNMITSRSGRSDLVQLLELENNRGSKNSISIGTGNSKTDLEYISSLARVLAKNSIFTSAVQGIAGNTTGQVDTAYVQNMISDYLQANHISVDSINVGNITGTDAQFESIITKYLKSDVIYAKFADFDEAKIKTLSSELIRVGTDQITEITGDYIKTAQISADQIDITNAFISEMLTIGEDAITQLTQDAIKTATISADQIDVTNAFIRDILTIGEDAITQLTENAIKTATISADQINVTNAFIDEMLTIGQDAITQLTRDTIRTEKIQASQIEVNTAFVSEILTVGEDAITQLTKDAIRTSKISGDQLDVTTAFIADILRVGEDAFTALTRDTIETETIRASQIEVNSEFVSEILVIGEDAITQLTKDTIQTSTISADQISVTNAFIDEMLTIGEDAITQLTKDTIRTETIYASQISLDSAFVSEILTIGEDAITQLTKDAIRTSQISADQIDVTSALIGEILTIGEDAITQLTKDTIQTSIINADNISVTNAFVSEVLTVGEDAITQLTRDTITTSTISADQINVTSAFVDDILIVGEDALTRLTNDTITTETVISRLVSANDVEAEYVAARIVTADSVIAGLVQAEEGDFDNLTADNAFIKYLEANLITASEIDVTELRAKLANIDFLHATEFTSESAFIQSLQAFTSTAVTTVIDDAYIKNAVINNVAVNELLAGNITLTDNMKILSENGKMVMNGTALQIMGTDKNGDDYVGIQLGYDTSSNPSLILRNEDGATILTPEGITSNAIADSLIVNNMIHDGTISESKLGFNVMKEGDSVTIEQIYLGDKQFGAEWTTFTNNTTTAIDNLQQDIESKNVFAIYIETPNGTNISGGNIVLNARLFKNNIDVTDDYDAQYFTWTRSSRDNYGDIYWNDQHSTGAKVITVTANDVRMNADFQCKFEYENVTVTSG